ncbi:hypothetical protein [Okeania sp. KiyG1]|uniref:hypothetical protein n=1 Tax=Okeania sp. KiyG1 TaxID=2720165 RepID=UPI001924993C|nr:hypothetical protein [Okeania sp. KiyG1]GGA27797.1 hypothetical protein CYANOKiyG1_44040 [Okeania sp. KiyG1]
MATVAKYYEVPLKRLNSKNAQGVVFREFEDVKIDLCKWPTQGKRPLDYDKNSKILHEVLSRGRISELVL